RACSPSCLHHIRTRPAFLPSWLAVSAGEGAEVVILPATAGRGSAQQTAGGHFPPLTRPGTCCSPRSSGAHPGVLPRAGSGRPATCLLPGLVRRPARVTACGTTTGSRWAPCAVGEDGMDQVEVVAERLRRVMCEAELPPAHWVPGGPVHRLL